MTAFTHSLLRLAPANPILLRVVTAGGRRLRHAFTRWIYLGLLIMVLLVALLASSSGSGKSLSELAKDSTQVFAIISYVQLGMICLLAPVFTAGAITQERDSQTYNILLATPLTNAQIVLGTLLSRMYYIVILLLSGVPVFAITLFFGGVTGLNIMLSFGIALSTGLATGSIAIAIAVFRLGTGKTVFWFYVFNAVFLVSLFLIDQAINGSSLGAAHTTVFTGMHPFLALQAVVSPANYPTPDLPMPSELYRIPVWFYYVYPAYAYVAIMLTLSVVMVLPSAIVLRRVAQRSDVGVMQYLRHLLLPSLENRSRKSRHVWSNPVAWREAATRAGTSARGLTRWATIVVGIAAAVALLYYYHTRVLTLEQTRLVLVGIVVVEFSVALLVATNTSASVVTREREAQTLDLLLVTPITSRYYIWGKLRGLVSFMLPFTAIPTITVLFVVIYDLIAAAHGALAAVPGSSTTPSFWSAYDSEQMVVFPEALLELPIFLTVLVAWACMLGLQLSLKWSRTIVAVMASVGILAGVSAILGVCGFTAVNFPIVGLIFSALSPFTGICVILDPMKFAAPSFDISNNYTHGFSRIVMFISFLFSSVGYCAIIWAMYRSMVKNFDMIIRHQHQ